MNYVGFPIAGFLAAILVLFPLPRLIRAYNIAGIALVFWIFQYCIIISVNTIIWSGNVDDSAPTWCKLSNKFRDVAPIAVTSATLCISKHLEFISSGRAVTSSLLQRYRKSFELVMCIAVPCLWMFLIYCFQIYNYYIIEDFGCYEGLFPSVVTLVILCVPPLLQCAATLVYGGITVRHLLRRRALNKFLTPFLTSRDPSLSSSHTFRLFALSILLGIPITIWMATELQALTAGVARPLASWKVIHQDDGEVNTIPRSSLTPDHFRSLMLRWWAIPAEAFTFFILFATSRDVLAEYHKIWVWFMTAVLERPAPEEWKWMRTKSETLRIPMFSTTATIQDPKSQLPEPK
jgi:hypothetical protein